MGKNKKNILLGILIGIIITTFFFKGHDWFPGDNYHIDFSTLVDFLVGFLGFGSAVYILNKTIKSNNDLLQKEMENNKNLLLKEIRSNNKIANQQNELGNKPIFGKFELEVLSTINQKAGIFIDLGFRGLYLLERFFDNYVIFSEYKEIIDEFSPKLENIFAFSLKNIGSGVAMNVFITMEQIIEDEKNFFEEYSSTDLQEFFQKKKHIKFNFIEQDKKYDFQYKIGFPYSLGVSDEMLYLIRFRDLVLNNYMIIINYEDIFGNIFEQKFTLGNDGELLYTSPLSNIKTIKKSKK